MRGRYGSSGKAISFIEIEFCDSPPPARCRTDFRGYCRGEQVDLSPLRSTALERPGKSAAIYREVCAVPYGMTTTYGTIARLAGTSARAVGQVMRRNPTPLVVPCHRVIGVDGSIRGFNPSIAIKEHLLAMERGRSVKRSAAEL